MTELDFARIRSQIDGKIVEVVRTIGDQEAIRANLEKDPVYQRYLATQAEIWRLGRRKSEISPSLDYVEFIKSFAEEHVPQVLFEAEHKDRDSFEKISLRRYQTKSGDLTNFFGLEQEDSSSCGSSEKLRVFSPLDERIIAEICSDPVERFKHFKKVLDDERLKRIRSYFELGNNYDPDSIYKYGSWIIVNSGNKQENLDMDKYFISDLIRNLKSKL